MWYFVLWETQKTANKKTVDKHIVSCEKKEDFEHQYVKIYCNTNQFPELQLYGLQKKPHGEWGLCKHYHLCFDTKLGNITFAIHCIPCACMKYTYTLDKPCTPSVPPHQRPHYQYVKYFTYWPMVCLKNWNIIHFSYKATSSEDI